MNENQNIVGRVCSKCKKYKLWEDYVFGRGPGGHYSSCKNCQKLIKQKSRNKYKEQSKEYRKNNKEKTKVYYEINREKIIKQKKEYYLKNKEVILEYHREYHQNNKENRKEYNKKNKEKSKKQQQKYYLNNKERKNKYRRTKRKTDIQYKLASNLRRRLHYALKGNYKVGSAVRDLGCSCSELKEYLEKQFQEGMTWDNWKFNGWHIDHIKPLSKFDLTNRQQFLEANNYTNLQPLWAEDNFKKGASTICS
jgi:hypothetical protein